MRFIVKVIMKELKKFGHNETTYNILLKSTELFFSTFYKYFTIHAVLFLKKTLLKQDKNEKQHQRIIIMLIIWQIILKQRKVNIEWNINEITNFN